jgi:hypothetical protein
MNAETKKAIATARAMGVVAEQNGLTGQGLAIQAPSGNWVFTDEMNARNMVAFIRTTLFQNA